jgi:nucleoid-associated protein EbfC
MNSRENSMKNIADLMKQAQQMQSKMADVQGELEQMEIHGQAAAGLVKVTLSGKGEMKALVVDPSLMKPDEAEILEDLIIAAHGDARGKMEQAVAEKMKTVTGGMPMPPGFGF